MAYFLGRDVRVALATEHGTAGFTNTNGEAAIATGPTADGNNIPDLVGYTIASNEIASGEVMKDVTGIDVTLGTVDEDIAYMGQNTALKAEIKHETTITITKKRQDGFLSVTPFVKPTHTINLPWACDEHRPLKYI